MCDAAFYYEMPSITTLNKSSMSNEIGCKALEYLSNLSRIDSGPKSSCAAADCCESSTRSNSCDASGNHTSIPHSRETIIDGFAIMSFSTKADLMLYTQQTNADRLKLSSTNTSNEKCPRSRRTCSAAKKRTKGHHNRTSENARGDPSSTNSNVEHFGKDSYTLDPEPQNGCLTNGICTDDSRSNRSPDTRLKPDSSDVSENHCRTNSLDSDPIHRRTPMGVLKHQTSDRINHVANLEPNSYEEQCSSRPNSHSSIRTLGSGHSHCHEDNKQPRPLSYEDTVLATTLDCHLAPLSTTWNDHGPNPDATVNRWPSPKLSELEALDYRVHPEVKRTMLSAETASPAPATRPPSVSRPKPCHQFSVAALTDETSNKDREKVTEASNLDGKSSKHSPHATSRRPHPKRSIQRHTGSCRNPSDTNVQNSSPEHFGCDPSPRLNAGDPITSVSSMQSSVIVSSNSTAAMPSQKRNGHCPTSGSNHPCSSVSSSSASHSKSDANHHSVGSRNLEQLVGMGTGTAERLFNSARFDEVYSLTMAALAGAEAKTRKRSTLLGGSLEKLNSDEEAKHKSPSRASAHETPATSTVLATDPIRGSCATIVSSCSSAISMRLPPTVTSVSPSHTTVCSTINSATGSNQLDPTDSLDASTHNLLHAAYNVRKFVNPVRGVEVRKESNQPQPLFPTLHPSLPPPTYSLGLPPPPPLIGGSLTQPSIHDLSQVSRDKRDAPRHPPTAPSTYLTNQLLNPSSHMSLSDHIAAPPAGNPPLPPPYLPTTAYPPIQDILGSNFKKQWASLFKTKGSGPHTSAPTEHGGSANGPFPKSNQPPTSSIPGEISRLFFPPPIPSTRPVPPAYSLPAPRSLPFGLNAQQDYSSSSVSSALLAEKMKAKSSMSFHSSILRRPVHPEHSCGRWADAHIRIAHYIRHHQAQTGTWPHRRDYSKSGTVVQAAAGLPLRPSVHPSQANTLSRAAQQPTPDSNRTVTSIASIRVPPPSALPSFNASMGYQGIPSFLQSGSLPADVPGEKNAFLNYLLEGLLSGSSGTVLPNGQVPSKESLEALWQSALRNAHNQLPVLSSSSVVRPQFPSAPVLSGSRQRWPIPTPTPRGALPTSVPLSLLHPTPSGSFNGFPSVALNRPPHLDMKRRRIEVPQMFRHPPTQLDVNGSSIPSVGLPNTVFYPPELPRQAGPKQDMLNAAANILNGYRVSEAHFNGSHLAAPVRQDFGQRSMLGHGLKLNPLPPHLAPIHPW